MTTITINRATVEQALGVLIDAQLHNYALRHDYTDTLITNLRAALAQQAEPVAWGVFEGENLHDFYTLREDAEKMAGYKGSHATVMPLYTALRAAPPQQAEPVEPQPTTSMDEIHRLARHGIPMPDDEDGGNPSFG